MNLDQILQELEVYRANLLMEIDELEALLESKYQELDKIDPRVSRKTDSKAITAEISPDPVPTPRVIPNQGVYEAAEAARPKNTYPVCPSCDGRMEPTVQTLPNGRSYNALVCTECNNEKVA